MQEQIGLTSGKIWQALKAGNELSFAQLRKAVDEKSPLFDWAVGWLAREDKIVITSQKRSFRLRLKDAQEKAVSAS